MAKGRDVLLLGDPIDEFASPRPRYYKEKRLQAADSPIRTRGRRSHPN